MKASQSTVAGNSAALGRTGLGASPGQRLPVPPRERKPALAALAVLLILGGALTSAYLVMASGQRVSAIRIARPVAAGQQIPADALEQVQVGDTGADYYINWSERAKVSRAYAAVPLVKGALLANGMVTGTDEAAKGRVIVGLALKPGQFPAGGLRAGQRVSLYAVGGAAGANAAPRPGTVLAEDATVYGIGSGGGDRLRSDQTTVDVAVPPGQAPQVTQAASAGGVAIALVPAGTTIQQPPKQEPPAGPEPDARQSPGTSEPPGQGGTGQGGTGQGGTGQGGTGQGGTGQGGTGQGGTGQGGTGQGGTGQGNGGTAPPGGG